MNEWMFNNTPAWKTDQLFGWIVGCQIHQDYYEINSKIVLKFQYI